MNGALPPKRYELSRNCRMTLLMETPISFRAGFSASTLLDGFHIPLRGALVELARAPDLVFRVRDHFLPLGDPAHRACEREDAGEHGDRNAERALHDTGIEIDVGVQLARDEIVVLQRDL